MQRAYLHVHTALVSLRRVEYIDSDGRIWIRGLPEGVPDGQAKVGVPIGPPPLASLGLPKAVEVRLHNQLVARDILTEVDARARLAEVQSAVMAAYRVDAHTILGIYQGQGLGDHQNGKS